MNQKLSSEALSKSREVTILRTQTGDLPPARFARLVDRARSGQIVTVLTPSSERAYNASWKDFCQWCRAEEVISCPASADSVARYLADLADRGRRVPTLTKRLAAIAHFHRLRACPTPTVDPLVRMTMKLLRREIGARPTQKSPLLTDQLRQICQSLPGTVRGRRDRALLLLCFAGAFRRSEVVSLDAGDIRRTGQGLLVTLRRSKTDQEGKGIVKAIPHGKDLTTCPVAAVVAWLRASGIEQGPLFRPVDRHGAVRPMRLAAESVAAIVKDAVTRIGLDPSLFGGHSLRAGLVTSAALAGADDRSIMAQTGHKSRKMVEEYVRAARIFENNAASHANL